MASGIKRSHRKIEFAKIILPEEDYRRGPHRCRESPVDVSNQKYDFRLNRGLLTPLRKYSKYWSFRNSYKEHGYIAPNVMENGQTYFENPYDKLINHIKAQRKRIKDNDIER